VAFSPLASGNTVLLLPSGNNNKYLYKGCHFSLGHNVKRKVYILTHLPDIMAPNIEASNLSKADLLKQVALLTERAVMAETKFAAARIKKDWSDFFQKKDGSQMAFSSLSETKRFFEETHPDLLKTWVEQTGSKLTSVAFHTFLSGLI